MYIINARKLIPYTFLQCSQLGANWENRNQYIGLIGSCETIVINIRGHNLECILDTDVRFLLFHCGFKKTMWSKATG